jgi:superfamily I DNA and RNA helicase
MRKLISAHLVDEEELRVRLTAQQAQILGVLGGRRRAAICGGAGTGKTMLAVDKAKRLAAEGFRTLLLCYNRPLAEHLAGVCEGTTGLEVASFHALCGHCCDLAKQHGRDLLAEAEAAYPGASLYDVHLPSALAYSSEVLPARYDAIVVDEGQDFRDEYWFPVEMLLSDAEESPLYIFYDPNQALYTKASSLPVNDEPFMLTANCRNTQAIHRVCYQFYTGHITDPPGIPGLPVEIVSAPTINAQAWAIQKQLNKLLIDEHVRAMDLVILVVDGSNKNAFYGTLETIPLPLGLRWSFEQHTAGNALLVETVSRFKGLERAGILLWVPEPCSPQSLAELLYVGSSRAKSLLRVVGTMAGCAWVGGQGRLEASPV